MFNHLSSLALAMLIALPVSAQQIGNPADFALGDGTEVRPLDASKMSVLNQHVGSALRQAFAGGSNDDVAALVEALRGAPLPTTDESLEALQGDWRCRTIKAGEMSPLIVYRDFACRVDGTTFEKTTGSQRTKGSLHSDREGLVYLGTGFVQGTTPPVYADLPEEPVTSTADGQFWSDIARVEVMSPDRARMLFPDPELESRLNVIYLTR